MIALTRRYEFSAAHVLAHPDLSAEENEHIYGKCANPEGHGHNYGLEVSVTGPVDPKSGRILDREVLDGLVRSRILDRFTQGRLNDDPAFGPNVPTAENIAIVVHDELAPPIAALGARLVRIRLHETGRNHFAYGELA